MHPRSRADWRACSAVSSNFKPNLISPSGKNMDQSSNRTASSAERVETVSEAVRGRRTIKLIGNVEQPLWFSPETVERYDAIVKQAVADAGLAPFHFDRKSDGLAEPWRAYLIWHDSCRQLASDFSTVFGEIKPGNRIPAMLSACGSVVIVNWIPESELTISDPGKRDQINREHLLAVGAFVQNLLLILEAAGCSTYWSSGGQLGSASFFERVAISPQEQLTAAVFVGYPDAQTDSLERLSGGQHPRRAPAERWSREIIWA